MKYRTTAAYISGAICGDMWWPQAMAGTLIQRNLRGIGGLFENWTSPATFRDVLLSCLNHDGGDFQNPEFTADTVIRIERRTYVIDGKYSVHVKEIPISDLEPDLVNADQYACDFMSEYD